MNGTTSKQYPMLNAHEKCVQANEGLLRRINPYWRFYVFDERKNRWRISSAAFRGRNISVNRRKIMKSRDVTDVCQQTLTEKSTCYSTCGVGLLLCGRVLKHIRVWEKSHPFKPWHAEMGPDISPSIAEIIAQGSICCYAPAIDEPIPKKLQERGVPPFPQRAGLKQINSSSAHEFPATGLPR